MIKEDEYLERIVAGIHAVSSNEADVRWNERINGRQFDVVVRFTVGTLDYLVLVEVKNRSRRASAQDVEAFVTKARDHQASKAVFVTVAGFQEGAIQVARRHGVDLFKLAFDTDVPTLSPTTTYFSRTIPDYVGDPTPRISFGDPTLVDAVENVELEYSDGRRFAMPSEPSQMTYYAAKTSLGDGRTLDQLLRTTPQRWLAEGGTRMENIDLDPPLAIMPPDEYHFPNGTLVRVRLTIATRMARLLHGNVGIEATSFASPVVYTNVLTGAETTYSLAQLPLNTDPLVAGRFYLLLHPLRYYHCAEVVAGKTTWELVESFQNEQLVRATFVQDVKYGAFYVPVSDKPTSDRLKGRLADYHHVAELDEGPPKVLTPVSAARSKRPKALRGR